MKDILLETIATMRNLEDTVYVKKDWLMTEQSDENAIDFSCSRNLPLHEEQAPVDVLCRDQMVTWYKQLIDTFKFHRETAEIALSYLDRFVSTKTGSLARSDRRAFQLASMTALYTAIKVHETAAMDTRMISVLSRGMFSAKHVERTEAAMLQALEWRMNPPTAMSFVRKLLDLLPEDSLTQDMREAAYELTKLQTELTLGSYELIAVPASTIAYAALMNSLESLGMNENVLRAVGCNLSFILGLTAVDNDRIFQVQNVLYESIVEQPTDGSSDFTPRKIVCADAATPVPTDRVSVEVSPRSISA